MACCRNFCGGRLLLNRLNHGRPALSSPILGIRFNSDQAGNEWKDGAVVYSTSKAAKHKVDTTVGYDSKKKVTAKPIIGGIITFSILMYYMFFYEGDKNDVFQTITPESIRENYLQSINPQTTETIEDTTQKTDADKNS